MTKESSQTQGKNKEQSRALSPKTAKLWFDGGTFPLNAGHGGSGAVLAFEGKEHSFSEYIGEKETNNRQRIYQQTVKSFQNNPEKIEMILADFYKLTQEPIFTSSFTILNIAKTSFVNRKNSSANHRG